MRHAVKCGSKDQKAMRRYISLFVFLVLTTLVATIARAFPPGDWYEALAKPEWTPPGWLFGPVWSLLYLFIAIAGWLVWRSKGLGLALLFWLAQLTFNGLWSYFMFGLNEIDSAMIDIALLWLAIAGFILTYCRVRMLASLMFVQYMSCFIFSASLKFSVFNMNS